jgi:ribosome-associated toxin RatA of RatAB toxin-antitoxin module
VARCLAALGLLAAAVPAAIVVVAPAARAERAATEAVSSARVAATPDHVWSLLADLEAWPGRAPDLATIELSRRPDGAPRIRQTTRVLGLAFAFEADVAVDPDGRRIDVALDRRAPGDFEHVDSTWQVTPDGDGGSRVELRSRARLRQPLVGFLERRALQRTVDALVQSVVDTVARHPEALPPVGAR